MKWDKWYVPKLMGTDEYDGRKTKVNEVIKGFLHDTSVHGIPASASATGIAILIYIYFTVK